MKFSPQFLSLRDFKVTDFLILRMQVFPSLIKSEDDLAGGGGGGGEKVTLLFST